VPGAAQAQKKPDEPAFLVFANSAPVSNGSLT
jgi:hypothetical protein